MGDSMRRRVVGSGAAAFLLAAAQAPVLGSEGDDALREELRRTREEVQRLLKRVETLEGQRAGETTPAKGPSGEVSRAVEDYLSSRGAVGNVSAPGVRSLKFSGDVVFWWERWDKTPRTLDPMGSDLQDVGWLRTSLRADAEITKTLRAAVEIRDSRYFGQEPSTVGQLQSPGAGTDLKQGWFEADDFAGSGFKARGGRQVLAYGDERLIGAIDWHTYGQSFDGLLLSRVFGDTKVDLFYTRIVEAGQMTVVPGVDNDDMDFFGVYTQTPKAIHHSDLDVYALGVHSGMDTAGETGTLGTTKFYTVGARLVGVKENLDWGLEGAHQAGRLSGDRLQAMAAHARVGYTMSDTGWTPRIGLEANLATGDHDPTNGRVGTFQNLFPTNHDKYGILDLLSWKNMHSIAASVQVKPSKTWTVTAAYHRFRLEESEDAWYSASGAPIRAGAAGLRRELGSEVDLVFSWKAEERMRIDFGGAQFFDGDFVQGSGDASDTLWVYFRITVSF